jgi:phosphoglycolate phosphatase-like HAD superfamily hydrolase
MLILDFDGTLTDVEVEGKPYVGGYLEHLALICARPIESITDLYNRFHAQLMRDPINHPWIMFGEAVAPATVDPYLRMAPISRMIFAECGIEMNDAAMQGVLSGLLYKLNYPKTKTAFAPNAARLCAEIMNHDFNAFIVTNSDTAPVTKKIRELAVDHGIDSALVTAQDSEQDALGVQSGNTERFKKWWLPRIYGDAKKYVVGSDPIDGIEPAMRLPNLHRPVLLWRPEYVRILRKLAAQCEITDWSSVLVVGDIFELDLAVPLAMGAHVALTVNDSTPQYEIEHLAYHERGHLLNNVYDALAIYEEIQ